MKKLAQLLLLSIFIFGCSKKETAQENVTVIEEDIESQEKVRYLALGDSYTIGQSVTENERFPVLLIDSLRNDGVITCNAKIIATTGWTTNNLISAVNTAALPDTFNLVSLLIGVNNQYQNLGIVEYGTQFEQLIQTAIQKTGGEPSNVFVLSIPDYGATPFGASNAEEIAMEIDQFNAINKQITEQYNITYFNITEISRLANTQPDLIAIDNLHPSGKMYKKWVDLMYSAVKDKVTK
jgi:acyl-CoA thioesterase I